MSEGMLELYRERYPHLKCSALTHSFNEALPDFTTPPEPRSPLRFVICGNINESCREATVRVCKAIAQVEDASLTLLSPTPRSSLQQLGLLCDGVRHETVSRDQVVQRLREADAAVLAHGFEGQMSPEEYRTIFPTRTIEYLICGRPILAHAPAECYLTRFLKEHDCALVVTEPSCSALLHAIERLRADQVLRALLVRNALRAAEMFEARRVAGLLRRHLELD
jgi:glycosyltransferase involved in cell wall biosynthesis